CLPPLGMGCRHANCAPETLPVGETGVARARADRPEGDRPTCTSLTLMRLTTAIAGAEGRGDRPVRRRSRFTLARARAEPLALNRKRRETVRQRLLFAVVGVAWFNAVNVGVAAALAKDSWSNET
ncbi:MAG: hypothetical protein KKA16_10105, partial [Alphaproteobacteria bacterium]|nr:hypothetical protein [Alphaproteobacteria bacterium]